MGRLATPGRAAAYARDAQTEFAPMPTPRRSLLAAFALLPLAACENAEVGQRRAFLEFLRTRAAEARGMRVPVPTQEELRAMGPYAAHWDVIRGFHAAMNDRVTAPYREIQSIAGVGTLSDLVARRADLARAREGVAAMRTALAEEAAKAEAAKVALRQSGEVAAVYDPIFERLVTAPARTYGGTLGTTEDAVASAERMGELIAANLVRVQIRGNLIETRDASLRARLEQQLGEMRTKAGLLQESQRRLQEAMTGR